MALIQLKEVNKTYRKNHILTDVNLSIGEGDIFGIIGQSGSGKTTLLNLVAGFIEPSEGEIVFFNSSNDERDLNKHLHKIKKQIGFTPQHNSFYPKLTVKENLWHFGRLYGMNKKMLEQNMKNLLNFTQLIDHQNKRADELSGGMQKRLDISCSLVHKPMVLILDEPTADLDPILQREILYLLSEVNQQGVTVVIASHHLDSIEHLCDKIAIVHNKRVHSHGEIEEVRKPFLRDHFTFHLKGGQKKDQIINRLKKCPIEKIVDKGKTLVVYPTNTKLAIHMLLDIIKEENLQYHDLHMKQPSLHEVFERIVSN